MAMASNSSGGKYPGAECNHLLLYTSSIKKGSLGDLVFRINVAAV